ncbi:MAG: sulfotransferase [Halioglobus sp.]|nr:sulfotransferase [Halioglobus sp.]
MTDSQQIPEVSLDAAELLATAREETGFSDFGCESFRPAFEKLLTALNTEAELNPTGRYLQHQRILNSLKNRLRMEAWIARHPEILQEELLPPVVIVGLTRTGTTMLHRILASDSRFYAPLWYEVRNPAPYMDWRADAETDQRIVEAEAEVAALLASNPELAAIHPMDPTGADEEILLLEHSFYSYVPNSFAHVPGYGDFVAAADNTPAYDYLKRQLRFLQWQKRRRGESAERWLLKAPHHLHFMSTLLRVFPGIQVIATHRDPVVSIPSTASFYYNLWLTGNERADKLMVAREVLDVFARGTQHTLQTRADSEAQFCDIWFEDTVAHPQAVIEKIYDFIDMPLTPEARAAMDQHREDNRRSDRPAHAYTLEEYGYTEDAIRARFEDYIDRFIN